MRLNWKNYILSHKDRKAYDEGADKLQTIIDPKDSAEICFSYLTEHPTIVILTKSLATKEVQMTFFHTSKKSLLLEKDYGHLALIGVGHQACAMKIDPSDIFHLSSTKKKIPSFEALIKCKTIDDITHLVPSNEMLKEKLDSHAIIPPLLAEKLFVSDSLRAEDILLTTIKTIHVLKQETEQAKNQSIKK